MRAGKILWALLLSAGLVFGWILFKVVGPAIPVTAPDYLYIRKGTSYEQLLKEIEWQQALPSSYWFSQVSKRMKIHTIKPGRYKLQKGASVFRLARMIRNGQQTFVKLPINKLRTVQDLAGKIGNRADSFVDSLGILQYVRNNDSLQRFGVDSNTVMALVMPYTYEFSWAAEPSIFLEQFHKSWSKYWSEEKKIQAKAQGLTPLEVSILASIVEEESTNKADRYKIASVYINRLQKGMKLQADPTVKFATKNFQLNRILYGHLGLNSSYNTYLHKGLPPGPICTPSFEALEAVLEAPRTNYLYFVASWQFDGSTIFTSNYADHRYYVKMFHQEQLRRAALHTQTQYDDTGR